MDAGLPSGTGLTMKEQEKTQSEAIPCAACGLPSLEVSPDGQWVFMINRHHGQSHRNKYPSKWVIEWLIERLMESKQKMESAPESAR